MKKRTIEEWDELMFSLLENEISGDEKKALMSEIYSDVELQARWESWSKTVYKVDLDRDDEFIESLKKKDKVILLPKLYRTVAASILLVGALGAAYLIGMKGGDQTPGQPSLVVADSANQEPYAPVQPVPSTDQEVTDPETLATQTKDEAPKEPTPRFEPAEPTIAFAKDSTHVAVEYPEHKQPEIPGHVERINEQDSLHHLLVKEIKMAVVEDNHPSRARGNAVQVTIESEVGAIAHSQTDNRINSILAKYEFAGLKRKYSIKKEMCEDQMYCYTLVVQDGAQKSIIKF